MPLPESVNRLSNRGQVTLEGSFHVSPVLMKVNRAVMAVLVSAPDCARGVLHQRWLHRPPEGIDRTHNQHRHFAVPTGSEQSLATVFGRKRLECPCSVGAKFRRYAQFPKYGPRLFIARNDQGIFAIPAAHFRNRRIHVPRLRPVPDSKLVLCGRSAQGADDHRRQCIGELTFESRALYDDHAVMLGNLVRQKWRKDVGQMYLMSPLKISARQFEILTHDTELNIVSAQNVAELSHSFLWAY